MKYKDLKKMFITITLLFTIAFCSSLLLLIKGDLYHYALAKLLFEYLGFTFVAYIIILEHAHTRKLIKNAI